MPTIANLTRQETPGDLFHVFEENRAIKKKAEAEQQWSLLDKDQNGYIEGAELNAMALWVYDHALHTELRDAHSQAESEVEKQSILDRLDANGDRFYIFV